MISFKEALILAGVFFNKKVVCVEDLGLNKDLVYRFKSCGGVNFRRVKNRDFATMTEKGKSFLQEVIIKNLEKGLIVKSNGSHS